MRLRGDKKFAGPLRHHKNVHGVEGLSTEIIILLPVLCKIYRNIYGGIYV